MRDIGHKDTVQSGEEARAGDGGKENRKQWERRGEDKGGKTKGG